MSNQEVKVKFSADASQYNSAIRSMVTSNSELSRMMDWMRQQDVAGARANAGIGAGDLKNRWFNNRGVGNWFTAGKPTAAMGGVAGLSALKVGVASFFADISARAAESAMRIGKELVRSVFLFADSLQNASDKTGLSVEQLHAFGIAAQQTGESLGVMEEAFNRLKKAKGEATSGNKEHTNAFETLGLNLNKSDRALLDDITKLFQKGEVSAVEFAAALKLLGKSGDAAIAVMRQLGKSKPMVSASPGAVAAVDELGDTAANVKKSAIAFVTNAFGNFVNLNKGILPDEADFNAKEAQLKKDKERKALDKIESDQAAADAKAAADKNVEDEKAKEREKVRNESAEVGEKLARKGMTPEQERDYLQKKVDAVQRKIDIETGAADDPLVRSLRNKEYGQAEIDKINALELEKAKLLEQMPDIKEESEKDADLAGMSRLSGNSMSRIGLFTGGLSANNPVLSELKGIKKALDTTNRAIRETL